MLWQVVKFILSVVVILFLLNFFLSTDGLLVLFGRSLESFFVLTMDCQFAFDLE